MAASLLDVTPGGDICAMRARVNSSRAFLAGAMRGEMRRGVVMRRLDASPCPKSFSYVFFGKKEGKFSGKKRDTKYSTDIKRKRCGGGNRRKLVLRCRLSSPVWLDGFLHTHTAQGGPLELDIAARHRRRLPPSPPGLSLVHGLNPPRRFLHFLLVEREKAERNVSSGEK